VPSRVTTEAVNPHALSGLGTRDRYLDFILELGTYGHRNSVQKTKGLVI
jgi:hypothetical protein